MKKVLMILEIIAFIVIVIVFFVHLSKTNIEIKEDNIKYIHFSYSTGNMMYANVSYKVDEKNDKYIATIKPDGKSDEDKLEVELDDEKMKEIIDVLNKYNISSWNNFHKSDRNVLDGNSFSFNLETKDGKEISASGYMKWPKNYSEICGSLDGIFEKLYQQNYTSVEFNDLNNLYYSYSNGDEANSNIIYEIKKNNDKYIASIKQSGKTVEEAKKIEVDNDTIKKILRVLNKYQVSKWDGFSKSDHDVLDGDSFSFSIDSEDTKVQASGYMMWPENYSDVKEGLDDIFNNLYKE